MNDSIEPDPGNSSQGQPSPDLSRRSPGKQPGSGADTSPPRPDRRRPVITNQPDRSRIDPTAFIAPTATVRGEVNIAAGASVWFGAVMRGDTERIDIGEGSNVQDQCVLHCDPGLPCVIGNRVTIGHGAIVHGAVVEDEALIGIGAIVLNGARIGRGAIIAAGALVTEGQQIPPGMLVVGTPGKVLKPVSPAQAERCREGTAHYMELAAAYRLQTQRPEATIEPA